MQQKDESESCSYIRYIKETFDSNMKKKTVTSFHFRWPIKNMSRELLWLRNLLLDLNQKIDNPI